MTDIPWKDPLMLPTDNPDWTARDCTEETAKEKAIEDAKVSAVRSRMIDFNRQSTNVTPYVQVVGITPHAVHLPDDDGRVYLGDTPLSGAGDTDAERTVNLRDALLRAAELLQDRIEDRRAWT